MRRLLQLCHVDGVVCGDPASCDAGPSHDGLSFGDVDRQRSKVAFVRTSAARDEPFSIKSEDLG